MRSIFLYKTYKPEFMGMGLLTSDPMNFLSIDHSRTVHSVQSSSTVFMILMKSAISHKFVYLSSMNTVKIKLTRSSIIF